MPSPSERARNNVRTGLFVVLTIALGFATMIAVTGIGQSLLERRHEYSVRFDLQTGVANLKPGGDVRIGGLVEGSVNAVRLVDGPDGGDPFIEVDFELNADLELREDAVVYVQTPLIGSDAWLSVVTFGVSGTVLPEGSVLDGSDGAGLIGTLLGPDGAENAREIIANARTVSDWAATFPDEYDDDLDAIVADVRGSTGDVRSVTRDVAERRWPTWSDEIDAAMAWSATFRGEMDVAVADFRASLETTRDILRENREPIRRTITNAAEASESVKTAAGRLDAELFDRMDRIAAGVEDAVGDARAALARIRDDYEGWSLNVGDALAGANLATQQLKLAVEEIRRNPWKVLYRPRDAEVEAELLYEAARSFSLAVTDLKAASVAAGRILDRHGAALESDPELLDRVRNNLVDPLSRYEAAQQRLLDVLFDAGE